MAQLITLGTIIDRTIEHYRHHVKELIGISLWIIVAASPFLLSGYISPLGVDENISFIETAAYIGMNILGFITTTLASLWITICLVYTIDARAQGTIPDHIAIGKKSWKMVPALLLLSLAIVSILVLAAIGVTIPGLLLTILNHSSGTIGAILGVLGVFLLFGGLLGSIYILARYSIELLFAQYVLLLEYGSEKFSLALLRQSVKKSQNYVRGQWWPVALRVIIPNIIISLIAFGITFILEVASTLLITLTAASLSPLALKLVFIGFIFGFFVLNAIIMPLYSLTTYYLYASVAKRS